MNNKMSVLLHLSGAEAQILDAILSLELVPNANQGETDEKIKKGDKLFPTEENLRKRAKLIQATTYNEQYSIFDWTKGFEILLKKDTIQMDGNIYQLTETGRYYANLIRSKRIGETFSDVLIRSDKSKAHAEFCQRVFGMDLCQADMMDMFQLNKLLEVLNLSVDNSALDLACGIGRVAEYISDTTGAHVLGIDIAEGAIQCAQARTLQKRNRLEFRYGNMDHLDIPTGSIDAVIAIAALHFANDLDETIRQLVETLTPDGQMGIFTFQYAFDNDDPDILLPTNTDLGLALQKHPLDFQVWDFTQQEIGILRKQMEVAGVLMEDFREEGNLDLCLDRIEECEIDLARLEAGQKRQFLYHVRLRKV